jgi:hypothetical protein
MIVIIIIHTPAALEHVAHREGICMWKLYKTETQLKEALIELNFALFIEIPQKGSNINTPPQHVNNNRSTILHEWHSYIERRILAVTMSQDFQCLCEISTFVWM